MTKDHSTKAENLNRAEKRLSMTKYILLLALILWPLGLFIDALISLAIFAVFFCLWAVSTYIAYMHYLSAKRRQ